MVAALFSASSLDAQERSRLSRGLADKLTAGAPAAKVIYEGPKDEVDRLAEAYGLSVEKWLPSGAVLGGSAARVRLLAQDPSVGYLSEDAQVVGLSAVPAQTTGANQLWRAFGRTGLFSGLTGKGIGIAVIDSGIAPHQDLRNRLLVSVDFTNTSTADGYGHGTHVASIIAGSGAGSRSSAGSTYVGMAPGAALISLVGSSRVDLQACKLEYSIVSPK